MSGSQHLKRHSMPTSWPIKRKNIAFIAKPNPGSFKLKYATSVLVLLRDVLGYAQTSKNVKYIVNHEEILVNGRKVTDIKFSCGIFDLFEIKKTNEKFVILFDTLGKLKLVPTTETNLHLKIVGKKLVTGKKFQLNFMNGYNILVDEKTFKSVNVNDTVVYDYTKKKVLNIVPLKTGNFVYIFDGKFKGQFAKIKEFIEYNGLSKDVVVVEIGKESHSTSKEYIYSIGTKLEEVKKFE